MESVCSGDLLFLKLCVLKRQRETWHCGKIHSLLSHSQVLALRSHTAKTGKSPSGKEAPLLSLIPILWTRSCACLTQGPKVCTVRHLVVLIFQIVTALSSAGEESKVKNAT